MSPDEAVAAMMKRAGQLGMSLVEIRELPPPAPADPGDEPAAPPAPDAVEPEAPESSPEDDGGTEADVRVFYACAPEKVEALTRYEPDLLPFMPCRVALYRDAAGRAWLATVNLELLITGGRQGSEATRREVVTLRDQLLDLLAAGAAGVE